eukprot:8191389-Karenia_brevis.AAC.1
MIFELNMSPRTLPHTHNRAFSPCGLLWTRLRTKEAALIEASRPTIISDSIRNQCIAVFSSEQVVLVLKHRIKDLTSCAVRPLLVPAPIS